MSAKVSAAYSWDFDKANGLMMWEGSPDEANYGRPGMDQNLLFKIYKNEAGEGLCYLKGHGVFSGDIYASGGKIGNMTIGDLVNNSVGRNLIPDTSQTFTITSS
jgi:hypothetical protein